MANPCRPGMGLICNNKVATVSAIARHGGADDTNRFAVTAGHAYNAGDSISYFPVDTPVVSLGRCVVSLFPTNPATDLCSCAATDATTWGAPLGFGLEADLFSGDVTALRGTPAVFIGSQHAAPLTGTIADVSSVAPGFEL